jgi:hypothetical protein
MRATGQARSLAGPLAEPERRMVAARAILGEWLGGSGGGWQDSGGVWPGMKLIEGALAGEGDPEYGISRGRLLPATRSSGATAPGDASGTAGQLVLVHGGMAQNVGPILEMVTEKYLLRSEAEWTPPDGHQHRSTHPRAAAQPATCVRSAGATATSSDRCRPSSPGPAISTPSSLIERTRAAVRRRLLGLLDARRHVRRRHGLHRRARSASRGARSACRRS